MAELKDGWLQRVARGCSARVKAWAKVSHMTTEEQEEFTKDFKYCGNCPWCCGSDGKPHLD